MTRFIPIYLILFLYACGGSKEEDLSDKDLATAPDTSAKTQQMLPELNENEDVLRMIDDCFTNDCPLDSILVDTVCPKHYFHNPVTGRYFEKPKYILRFCNFTLLYYNDTITSRPLINLLSGMEWKHEQADLNHDENYNARYVIGFTYYFQFENRILRFDLHSKDTSEINCFKQKLKGLFPRLKMLVSNTYDPEYIAFSRDSQ